ncbi:Oidioi.mRNA.OKI2018_I69.chr1.g149.t1.cds [Oikopleura dioica]|uniref:Oidioi.mRNA.OKI2018_I69.chr1.g149.t1.cds n=1 Tax=Oikopleura dioica TaxID=34765 RepID=A0ABN7SN68_OIKDI|nr:Oidioi.mRNA.OKI2018_I69.chr1.g149.t1.cds [Oikopleura dioica]
MEINRHRDITCFFFLFCWLFLIVLHFGTSDETQDYFQKAESQYSTNSSTSDDDYQESKAEKGNEKRRVVVGILATFENYERREAQRETWLLSSEIEHKYIIDSWTPEWRAENEIFGDIVSINASFSGLAYAQNTQRRDDSKKGFHSQKYKKDSTRDEILKNDQNMFTTIKSFFGYSVEEERVPAMEKSELEGWEIIDHEQQQNESESETPSVPVRRPENNKTAVRKSARRIQDLIPTMPSDKYQKPSKKTKKGSKVGRTMMTRSMRQPIQQPRSNEIHFHSHL